MKNSTAASGGGKKRVKIVLKSIGLGMLQNPMTESTLDVLQGLTPKVTIAKDTPIATIALGKLIRGPKNELGIPLNYLTSCISEAGRYVKNGKKQISTASSTTIYSLIEFGDIQFFPFINQAEDSWLADRRKGNLNNGGTSVAVPIIRPLFPSWGIELEVVINTNPEEFGADETTIKKLFEAAGTQVGIGDYRPSCKGPHGRFKVETWEVLEEIKG